MKCERCLGDKENIIGGVCFDCFHDMDDKQISHLIKKAYMDMWEDVTTEKPKPIKVEFFESTQLDILKSILKEFLSTVNRIISINYAVDNRGIYSVMVVYV